MKPTDISVPDYFHKVVDCQWACPAHTPVPEYIRLIAAGRYSDAYMINWESNVFPGVLGRTCDRPCEPACRRGRVEKEPVAICRLKRVAADFKDDIRDRLPKTPEQKNGKRIALVGGGPASLTVARDLAQDHGRRQVTPAELKIRFETSNIFSFDETRHFDFIISCNFTHHLTDEELVRFIQWMDKHAKRGWFINDLHRHRLPYYFVKAAFRILPLSRMMRSDGPISISRAFVATDWRRFLVEAGIPAQRTSIKWYFPFRYVVACQK